MDNMDNTQTNKEAEDEAKRLFDLLSDKYNKMIDQYQSVYIEYINNLDDAKLSLLPNTSFTGTTLLEILDNSSAYKCKQSCSIKPSCNAGLFNNDTNSCMLYSGEVKRIMESDNTISIMEKNKKQVYLLKELNSKLIDMNRFMTNIANKFSNKTHTNQTSIRDQSDILRKNYQELMREKEKVNGLVKEYDSITSAYDNSTIVVNSQYSKFMYLVLIAIGLAVTLKQIG